MIPWKLYARMTDMAEDLEVRSSPAEEHRLIKLQDEIGWPWRASKEQIDDWNNKKLGCDCQRPEPISGVAGVSESCPVHNSRPSDPTYER